MSTNPSPEEVERWAQQQRDEAAARLAEQEAVELRNLHEKLRREGKITG